MSSSFKVNVRIVFISAYPKMLNEFTYKDNDINEIVSSCMSNVSMVGIIGSIYFKDGADPVKNVHVERIQGMYCTIRKHVRVMYTPLNTTFM